MADGETIVITIDIETRPPPMSQEERMGMVKVPGNYKKPESIEKYRQEHADEYWGRLALDPMDGEIALIGYAVANPNEFGEPEITLGDKEVDTLLSFARIIRLELLCRRPGIVMWAGHNLLGFDAPYIVKRVAKYIGSVSVEDAALLSWLVRELWHPKPWGSARHIDTMMEWKGAARNFVSLTRLAQHFGIHVGPKVSNEDIHKAGIEELAERCLDDVRVTQAVWDRLDEIGIINVFGPR